MREHQLLCFFELPVKNQFLNLFQMLFRVGIDSVPEFAMPQGILIQLDSVPGSMSVHHGTQESVPHGRCVQPA